MATLTRDIAVLGSEHSQSQLDGRYDIDTAPNALKVGYNHEYLHPDEDNGGLGQLPSSKLARLCATVG